MNAILSEKEQELNGASYMTGVSIILPFEPKMSIKAELEHRLKIALGKAEKKLVFNYPSEKAMPVINKLRQVIRGLNFNTHQKRIAIFVSPLIERVFYLDVAVEEKIVDDESFEIRDLIYSKKQNIQYLILLLSSESSEMYLGNCSSFVLIKSNTPQNVYTYERDMPEKVTRFSDQHKHKETLTHKFVHHMDEGLSLILNAYPLPLFVLVPEKAIGHFKKITKNMKSIVEYIYGNFDNSTEPEIRQIMKPYVADWKKITQQHTLQKTTTAMSENKLVHGINKVRGYK
jgi:Bacterial archaeo-eukaryotic release factor family 3